MAKRSNVYRYVDRSRKTRDYYNRKRNDIYFNPRPKEAHKFVTNHMKHEVDVTGNTKRDSKSFKEEAKKRRYKREMRNKERNAAKRRIAAKKAARKSMAAGATKESQVILDSFLDDAVKTFRLDKVGTVVKKSTQKLKSLSSDFLTKFSKYPKLTRFGTFAAAGIISFSVLRGLVSRAFGEDRPVIPRHYDKGYDIIKENLSDFGSPVNLTKASSHTITPYYSSVRDGIRTNVNSVIRSNLALNMSSRAIGHNKY